MSQIHACSMSHEQKVMTHIWLSHVTHMNESCHTYAWATSHIYMIHVTHMNESHIRMSHVTHMNESYVWRKRHSQNDAPCVCVTHPMCGARVCVCVCVWHIRCVAQVCVCVCVAHPNCTSLCVCATHPTYSCRTYAIHVARVNEITTHIHNQATTHSTYAYTPQLWHPLSKHKMSIWKRHDPCTCARRIWKRPLYTLLDNKFMHYLFHTLFFSCIIYFIHYDFDHCTFFIYDGQDHRISYVVNEITTRYVMDSCMIDVIHYGGDYYTLV